MDLSGLTELHGTFVLYCPGSQLVYVLAGLIVLRSGRMYCSLHLAHWSTTGRLITP
jgi:hypothetical protein